MAEKSTDTAAESILCSEEMKPISSFINDRRKMLEVAFSAVDADKLKEIIPPFLKDSSLDELKLICYEELCCLTDEALKSILEDSTWDETSATEDKKDTSSMESCTHEPRTICGFETKLRLATQHLSTRAAKCIEVDGGLLEHLLACRLEDSTNSSDSKNKDILDIGISEEEVGHLLKEIPDISKDTLDVSSPSSSVASTSGKKRCMSDDVSTVRKDSRHTMGVKPDALDEDSLELWELEDRARSIRSLIMECDDDKHNVSEISDKLTGCHSSEYHNILDDTAVTQKHKELDPLFFECTSASKVVQQSSKSKGTNSDCKNKCALYETVGHNSLLSSGDDTVMETKMAENSPRRVALGSVNGGDNETFGCDSYNTSTLGSPSNHNSSEAESVFHNTDQVQITISTQNGDSLSKKDLHLNSHSSEKMKEKSIHKVVETSKMCKKLRERIKRTQQLKKFKDDNIKAKTVILGTVEEYKSLNMK